MLVAQEEVKCTDEPLRAQLRVGDDIAPPGFILESARQRFCGVQIIGRGQQLRLRQILRLRLRQNRQRSDPLAGRREQGIGQRRCRWRYTRFADAAHKRAAFDEVDIMFRRRVSHFGNRIIGEIRLLNRALV